MASDETLGEPEADQAGRSHDDGGRSHDDGAAVSEAVVRGGSSGSLSAESIVGWFVKVGLQEYEEHDLDGNVIRVHRTTTKPQTRIV